MIRRIVSLLVLLIVLGAWSAARADFVDHFGGHGPLTCSSPVTIKDYGQVQAYNGIGGACERWTGDMGQNAPSNLYFPTAGMRWFIMSPLGTSAYACMAIHNGNYGWCTDSRIITTSWQDFGSTPVYIQISYTPPCPTTNASAFVKLQWAPGAFGDYTPLDGAELPTVIIGDGHVAPGLPYGNPLKLSDADWCVADLTQYPNLPAWSLPWWANTSPHVAAVYSGF